MATSLSINMCPVQDDLEHPPFSLEEKQDFELPASLLPLGCGPSPLSMYYGSVSNSPNRIVCVAYYCDAEGESTPSTGGGRKRGRGSCTPSESPSSSPVRTTKRKRL